MNIRKINSADPAPPPMPYSARSSRDTGLGVGCYSPYLSCSGPVSDAEKSSATISHPLRQSDCSSSSAIELAVSASRSLPDPVGFENSVRNALTKKYFACTGGLKICGKMSVDYASGLSECENKGVCGLPEVS